MTVGNGQVTVGSYEYDENGNMTCRVEAGITYKQEYNTENRISSIMKLAEGTCEEIVKLATKWDFAYDGNGTRTATLTTTYDENGSPTGTSWTAYYFGGAYEVRSDSTTIKYYSFAGQTIMNDGSGLKYFLTDHLGSVVAVTDENGDLVSQQRYLPFGAVRSDINDITQTDYGYTGQRNLDNEIGLMDYRARFYSPVLNRFIQPDSIVPHLLNSQSYNRYSYVYNNPIIYTDPSGHAICMEGTSSCYDQNTKKLLGNISGSGCTSCWSTKEEDDEKEEVIPEFEDWVNLCIGDPSNPLCPQPPGDLGCTAPPAFQSSGSSKSFGCHVDHFEVIYHWEDLNYMNVGINALSILGHVVLAAGIFGMFGLAVGPAAGFYAFTQGVSLAYEVATADDPLEPLTMNVILDHAPGFAFAINIAEIQIEIQSIREVVPIYVPDEPYLGPIQPPLLPDIP